MYFFFFPPINTGLSHYVQTVHFRVFLFLAQVTCELYFP